MDDLFKRSIQPTQREYQNTLKEFNEMQEFFTQDQEPGSLEGLDGLYIGGARNIRFKTVHYNQKTKTLNITALGGPDYLEIHNDEIKTIITTAQHVDLTHCPNLVSFVSYYDGGSPGKILCPNKNMDYMRVADSYIVDINGSQVKTMNVGTHPPFFLLMHNDAEVKKFKTEWPGENVIQSESPIQGDRLIAFNHKYLTLNKGDISLNSEIGDYDSKREMIEGFRNHIMSNETLKPAERIIADNFFKRLIR